MSRTGSLGLDLEILRRLNRDRLVRVLEDAPGSKDLVIDSELLKMLDRIAGATLLRSHGVEKMHKLQRVPPPVQCGQRVYIVRPALVTVKYIADHVHEDARTHPDLSFAVHATQNVLQQRGSRPHSPTKPISPPHRPVLTQHQDAFLARLLRVRGARALNTLQGLFGAFPNESPKKALQLPEIGHLFVFDRDADLVTPLLSQLTYEGALDEHFGIRAGVVELPKEVAGPDAPTKLPINARDTIYDNIRNRHFAGVSGYLITRAHEV
ncbi:putative vacuolar protein sorting-associated protein 33B-like [Penaeus vannamei]|uniref:Putative vacuolar protein sorting-associated protein 33B-like n=1 Tax=Penaeus vannamei TaxID=6689 RepID=A0A423SSD1_PENVA|nr:putative vacuolar protein sorting-associated protein 33B-like [Penaeus vannamei]